MIKFNNIGINTFSTAGTQSVTGTTAETIMSSITVPANTFKAGDLVTLDAIFSKTGTANQFVTKMYWVAGATATLSGAVQIMTRTSISTVTYSGQSRKLYIRTADGTGTGLTLGTEVASSTTSVFDDDRSVLRSNIAINWTTQGTFFSTIQLSSSSDTGRSYYLKIWEI